MEEGHSQRTGPRRLPPRSGDPRRGCSARTHPPARVPAPRRGGRSWRGRRPGLRCRGRLDSGRSVPTAGVHSRRHGPAVWYCGARIYRPFSSVKRSSPCIGASMPVTHTSPSPWAACASPQRKQRALDLDRQVARRAPYELPRVHVPAEAAGRHDGLLIRSGATDAHRPEEGLDRDPDVVAQVRELAVLRR
jgi:hypothetical protein